jgi:hypothetical protein
MFSLTPDSVTLLTDTLATTNEGEPLSLVTKCGLMPHLDLVIAVTGTAQLGDRWRSCVLSDMLCRDIDMLDLHAPNALQRIWAEVRSEFEDAMPADATSTVYHLGLSEDRGTYGGYVYRSTSGFQSEVLEPGFRVRPRPDDALRDPPGTIDEMVSLAHRLREEQEAVPIGTRIHIGGDLVLCVMHERSVVFAKVDRFSDFEDTWQRMNDRLRIAEAS